MTNRCHPASFSTYCFILAHYQFAQPGQISPKPLDTTFTHRAGTLSKEHQTSKSQSAFNDTKDHTFSQIKQKLNKFQVQLPSIQGLLHLSICVHYASHLKKSRRSPISTGSFTSKLTMPGYNSNFKCISTEIIFIQI